MSPAVVTGLALQLIGGALVGVALGALDGIRAVRVRVDRWVPFWRRLREITVLPPYPTEGDTGMPLRVAETLFFVVLMAGVILLPMLFGGSSRARLIEAVAFSAVAAAWLWTIRQYEARPDRWIRWGLLLGGTVMFFAGGWLATI